MLLEDSLRALYMGFSAIVFAIAVTMLIMLQKSFDSAYREVLEAINGGYVW